MRHQKAFLTLTAVVAMLLPGAGLAQRSRGELPPPPGDFRILSTERGFAGKVVKGAPYSATAVTETAQVLADGNRIDHKNTATVYRDSEGRTRREETISAIGPWASGGGPHQMILISDPVAGTNYVLDPTAHTARKMFDHPHGWGGSGGDGASGASPDRREPGVPPHDTNATLAKSATTETLGKLSFGGVDADGTRTTITIAAGAMGNELPIKIVDEKWISSDLQVVVMSKHSDPLQGETTYQLSNIIRGEQPRTLFDLPSGYTITEASSRPTRQRRSPSQDD
jgi:hypothetical protein